MNTTLFTELNDETIARGAEILKRGGLLGKRNGFRHEPDVLRGVFCGHDCTSLGRNTRNLLKK